MIKIKKCKPHPLYSTYHGMKQRCLNKKCPDYKNYGERGIGICKRWLGANGFRQFVKDMGERPNGTTLDRKNNNKGYCKGNCRWATIHEQRSNTRRANKDVGVSFDKERNKWRGKLRAKGIYQMKRFDRYEDALSYRKLLENQYLKLN